MRTDLALLLIAAGLPCVAAAQTAPPIPTVTVTPIATVQQNPVVLERDGTYSTAINGYSYWAFNDTALSQANASGQNFFSNSLSWSTSLSAGNGISLNADQVDSSGLPAQFVPFTDAENLFDTQHAKSHGTCQVRPCGESLALWPGPIVYNPANQQVIIPFGEIVRGGPVNGFKSEGSGISLGSVNADGSLTMTRPVQGSGANPELLWPVGTQAFTDQGFILNGYFYAYGGKNVFVTTEDLLARVPVSEILTLSDWTYYAGKGVWSTSESKAKPVFDGSASGSSVFFDAYLNEWVAIFSGNFTNSIYYAVANAPEGPWSASTLLATGLAGYDNNADYAARAHPELSPDGGMTEYVTYVQSTGAFGQDLPTLQVVFGPPQ